MPMHQITVASMTLLNFDTHYYGTFCPKTTQQCKILIQARPIIYSASRKGIYSMENYFFHQQWTL